MRENENHSLVKLSNYYCSLDLDNSRSNLMLKCAVIPFGFFNDFRIVINMLKQHRWMQYFKRKMRYNKYIVFVTFILGHEIWNVCSLHNLDSAEKN